MDDVLNEISPNRRISQEDFILYDVYVFFM